VNDTATGASVPLTLRPLRVIPDANIFARADWVDQLLREADEGRVSLYWSPKVAEEVGRVRLWVWLKRALREERLPRGSAGWKRLWRRYSVEAHDWFARVSPFIQVIEDRPPHEASWAEPHPDPNDAWLWNAARRINADIVVTLDLRDAPPADSQGAQHHEQVIFAHPRTVTALLNVWHRIRSTRSIPDDLERQVRDASPPGASADAAVVTAQMRVLLARMAEEVGPAPSEADPTP
jgi:hypothetical protein